MNDAKAACFDRASSQIVLVCMQPRMCYLLLAKATKKRCTFARKWFNEKKGVKGDETMNNFTFHVTTDIRFGKDRLNELPEVLNTFGKTSC